MTEVRDWQRNRDMWVRVLVRQTGKGVHTWNRRIEARRPRDQHSLRAWLTRQGVTGYAQTLLVMERYGYPDFLRAGADELVAAQYADRPHLRSIYDAIVKAVGTLGNVAIQTRKTYVSLVSPRRTFARVQATTKTRVDLGLRLEGQQPGGRLKPSTLHPTMRLQVGLTSDAEVDTQLMHLLRRAYIENS